MKTFGLIGKNISYSFSENYFTTKFKDLNIQDCSYSTFDIQSISELESILKNNPNLKGLNITIPYKEEILPLLHKISKKARQIKAVNCIKISKKGTLKGYNTDCLGFKKSIKPLLKKHHTNALLFGTGGASKAIEFALKELNINVTYVSRTKSKKGLTYSELDKKTLQNHQILINCTPLGTFPDVDKCLDIPYNFITASHIVFDLIYNPAETLFLKKAAQQGATINNGYDMLVFQAEKSWEIWNKSSKNKK